jgi:hypothetical protein
MGSVGFHALSFRRSDSVAIKGISQRPDSHPALLGRLADEDEAGRFEVSGTADGINPGDEPAHIIRAGTQVQHAADDCARRLVA